MAKTPRQRATLTPAALHDIREITAWSENEFGAKAAARYRALIIQALRDIDADPGRPGSKERPELIAGARTYHLSLSRSRVAGEKVKTPRHFVLYRSRSDGTIEVGRILHEGRDLVRHLPEEYKQPNSYDALAASGKPHPERCSPLLLRVVDQDRASMFLHDPL